MSSQRLRDHAYQYIRKGLTEGRLHAGQRLSVGSLAKDIGISRTPVAEALLRLTMENIVEQVPRVGTIVRRPGLEEMADLYELRELLEAHTAARAAERIEEGDLKLLEQLVREMGRLCHHLRDSSASMMDGDSAQRFMALDLCFHKLIARAAGNLTISRIIEDTRMFVRIMSQRRRQENTLTSMIRIYRTHGRIFTAIKRGDTATASLHMRLHIQRGRDGVLAYLAENSRESYSSRDLIHCGLEELSTDLEELLGSEQADSSPPQRVGE